MTGSVDADKVILRENITLAGGYTQVGNLTKAQNGTATFQTKGKSVMDALTEIFSKRLQPSITAQPSIGAFTLTGAGAVEAGTKVAAAAYSGTTLNAGSYQYGPATGVTATNWKVERITNAATTQVTTADAASLTAGSDNNGGAGFIIGDAGGENAVSSLKYRVTAFSPPYGDSTIWELAHLSMREFSPPYGDGTCSLASNPSMSLFSPPYGDGTHCELE